MKDIDTEIVRTVHLHIPDHGFKIVKPTVMLARDVHYPKNANVIDG